MTFKKLFWFSQLLSFYLFLMPSKGDAVTFFVHFDKVAHIIVFVGLAFLFDKAYQFSADKKISILISYGLIVEVLQAQTGRESSVPDAIADLVGIFLYFYVFKYWVDKIDFAQIFIKNKQQ
ncbi:MAG: VanZ family protein [Gammaproteobacteria bacterium]|nr:VanZ family protein [Gammaproteobacteria bacterium]